MSIRKRYANVVVNCEFLYGCRKSGLLWILLALSMSLCSAATAPQDDLLTSLINHSEAAWQKIHALETIQYTHETEWLARGREKPYQGIAQIKKKGDWSWSRYRRTILDRSSGQIHDREIRRVINDKYIAEWPDLDNELAYQWDHVSVDSISRKQKSHLRTTSPSDFLPVCFGDTKYRFRESIGDDASKFEASEVKGEGGQILYKITRKNSETGPGPDLVWIIDPEKGFLAIESTFYPGGNYLLMRRTMRIEEISPGVWYPVGYEETRFDELKAGQSSPNVVSWVKSTLKDIKINEPLPDEQFNIEALGFDEAKREIRIVETGLEGEMILYTYRDGKLVRR